MTAKNKAQVTNANESFSSLNEGSSAIISNPAIPSHHDLILGLQTAIDQTGSYIFTKDTAGRYTYVNIKVQELFGAKFDDIIGKDDSHFFDLETTNNIRQNDRRILDFDATIEQEEATVIKSTGENRIYWAVKKPVKNADGQIIGMCGVSTDITELKRTEKLLQTTLESTDEGILMIAPDGHVLSANKRFKELWRVPQTIVDSGQDDLLLKHVLDQLVDPNEFLSLVRRLYDSNEEARDILNFKDGRVFARYTQSLPIGKSKGRIWCFRDVTDYKKIEGELREKEERLALATLYNGIGIWDWNLVTLKMVWDDSMYALYHIRREDFIGTEEAWRASLHPDDLERGDREVEAAIKGEKPFDTEFRVIWPDGAIRYIKAVAKVLCDEQGKPLRMLGTNVDITERKLVELSLRQESEKNIALLRNASDGIHILDKNGNIIEASDSFCQMMGYSRDEVIGMHASKWDSNFTDVEISSLVAKQLTSKTRTQFETRHRRKNGTEFDVEVSGYPVELLGNQVLFNSSRDITERKKSALLLENTKNELLEAQRIAHLGSWSLDIVSNEISWSEELFVMQGLDPKLPPPEFIESAKLFTPESWERLSGAISSTVKSGTPYELELEMVKPDGSHGWMLGRGEAVRDERGEIVTVRGIAEDITERKLSQISIKESEQRYQIIFDMNPLPMWVIDESTLAFLMVNQFAVDHYGYSREEFSRMTLRDIRPKEDIAELDRTISSAPNRRRVGEWRHKKKDGTIINVIVNTTPMMYGNIPARIAIIQDITERKLVEKSLRVTSSVFDISQEAIAITDADNNFIDVNPAFTKITGFSRQEVIGKNPNILSSGRQSKDFYENLWNALNDEGIWRGEIWNRRKSGEVYPEMLSISVHKDNAGKVLTHVAMFSDISNLKQHEDELVRVAHFDALTSIPNRILLADRMKQAISQTARDKNLMAVCYLDLDGFKPINDTLGHQVGDDVLIEMARRIGVTIRGGDTVARLGGDEFVILLLGLSKGEECVTTLERLLDAIAVPIEVKDQAVSVTASIGVSIYPLDEDDPDTLLRHADQAMYIAKQSGKNRFHIYDVNLDKRARDQNDFLKSMRTALEQNQFELHYQPKVNLRTKELVGAEALIRWRHPERGLLSPAEFLRQVDNTDLDIAIGEWVTSTALEQIHHWRSMGLDIEVSINISGYHLETKDFVSKLQQQLVQYPDLPFGKLQIEVLETVALNDVKAVQGIIESCRKIGVGFALDDFGTGYSSLSYLSTLPVDTLKIDQSFVRDMMEDKGDMAIVQGIIALAKAFGRQTVAEGIETKEHYQALLDMGCEIGQGYGIARPMPAEDLAGWHAGYR